MPRISNPEDESLNALKEVTDRGATANNTNLTCRDLQAIQAIEQYRLVDETEPASTPIGRSQNFRDQISSAEISDIKLDNNIVSDITEENIESLIANLPTSEELRQDSIEEVLQNLLDSPDSIGIEFGSTSDLSTTPIYGLGKNNLLIDALLFAGQTQSFIDNFILDKPLTEDKIRYYTNSVYALQTNNQLVFLKNISQNKYIEILKYFGRNEAQGNLSQQFKFQELYTFKYGSSLKATQTDKQIILNTSFIKGKDFIGTINGQSRDSFSFERLVNNNIYYDNCFKLQLPFLNNELLNSVNLIGAKLVDIIPNYNFYIKQYENIANLNNTISKENVFPNLYVLNELLKPDNQNTFYESLITLNNGISYPTRTSNTYRTLYSIKNKLGKYFETFGIQYNILATQDSQNLNLFNNKNKNIILLSDTVSKLKEINNQKRLFPMSIEVAVPTDKTAIITEMLYSSGLIDTFIGKLFDAITRQQVTPIETVISEQIIQQDIQQADNPYVQATVKNTYDAKKENLRYYSITQLLEDMLNSPSISNESECLLVGDRNKIINNSSGNAFENNLKMIILKSKLEDFMKNNLRTYEDIINGKLAYNETIAYRVAKYEKDSDVVIQNYWFANNPNIEFINLIDTQIKYNKDYTYKIFAYQFVLGNKYSQRINTNVISPQGFMLQLLQDYDPNIVEVELLASNTRVSDSPPISPEVLFVPYNKIDNKLGLFINGKTGKEELDPVIILEEDVNKVNLYNKNLKNKVNYSSDDAPKMFQIFKLENKPRTYSDFKNGIIKNISTDIDENSIQTATAAAHIDSIEPNKKYYYTFRTIDVHDNISNPSSIYEVEIINDKGTVLPVIKLFEFEKPKYDIAKKIRRFIKIQPSIQHALFDKQSVDLQNLQNADDALVTAKLGISNIGVPWGKTFKLVVTSIQTGKKMEIKFKFNYKTQ